MEPLGTGRKQQIVAVALEIVSAEGAKRLSMSNIAERIGVSEPALYRHFKNKQHLMQAMIHHVGQNLTTNINKAVAKIDDPIEKLRKVLQVHLAYLEKNKGIPRIVFSESVHQNDPLLRQAVLQMVNNYQDLIRGILARARETGQVRKNLDIDAAATVFLGLVQSTALLWSLSDFEFSVRQRARPLWQVFYKGLT